MDDKDLSITASSEWGCSKEWEYTYDAEGSYTYNVNYSSGPTCKVIWVEGGQTHEKEYSSRERAIEKQIALLIKKIPAIINFC